MGSAHLPRYELSRMTNSRRSRSLINPHEPLSPEFCRSQSMANEPQSAESPSLSATVERCLKNLQSLSLALDTYGNEDDAAMLHEVIDQLQKAVPAQSGADPDPMD